MAEGTYEYECMRAELLGIEKPDYDEFINNQQEKINVAQEEQETENLKEADHEEESMKRITGGLDELNSILEVTQKKINKFKASCGSLTNLLKFKLGATSSTESVPDNVALEASVPDNVTDVTPVAMDTSEGSGPRKSDLAKALDNHVDRFDSMIEKAEKAQYSMHHQSKEMKRFLN